MVWFHRQFSLVAPALSLLIVSAAFWSPEAFAEDKTATPSFSLVSGTYAKTQTVSITDSTADATISYSLTSDGHQVPWRTYTGPLTISQSSTIQAVASSVSHGSSGLASAAYTIAAEGTNETVATPRFAPASGTYATTQTVAITDATNYAVIYFSTTVNGHETPWAHYTSPINVGPGVTAIQAVAKPNGSLPNYASSPMTTSVYTITGAGDGTPWAFINGACGTMQNTCSAGTLVAGYDNGINTIWSCAGKDGGSGASCTSIDPVNGACGTTRNTCSIGTLIAGHDDGINTIWSCAGKDGGSGASCTSIDPVNGVCGPSNNLALLKMPTTGLCATGQSSTVTGSGPWSWSCSDARGGSSSACSSKLAHPPLALPTVSLPAISPAATTYFVNTTTGSDVSHNGLSATDAFRTIHKATSTMQGGDVVLVASGTYNESIKVFQSGTPEGYTTIMGMPGQARPVIISSPRIYDPTAPAYGWTINIEASYVRISGFDASWQYDPTLPSLYGTAIGACCAKALVNGVPQAMQHHIFVDNNVVHDSPTGGLNFSSVDYVTLVGNTVYNNAYYAPGQGSGISLYESVNYDTQPGYHSLIINNVSFHNIDGVLPNYTQPDGHLEQGTCTTDGNGIIIDDSRRSQSVDKVPYTGSVLIMGNIVYGNGGRGISVYESDNVSVVNNTSYHNIQDPQLCTPSSDGDVRVSNAGNISWFNNVIVSAGIAHSFVDSTTTGDVEQNNLLFGGSVEFNLNTTLVFDSSNLVGIDPELVAPSITPMAGNFRLMPSSPAIGSGITFTASEFGIDGDVISAGSPVNMGAYYK